MSFDKLKLEIQMALTQKVLGPLKAIQSGSSDTAKALKAAKEQLKDLNRAQENISAFQKVSKDASVTANMLKTAQAEVKRIRQEIDKVPVPTRDMARAMKEAKEQAAKLKEEHNGLIVKQQRLRDVLKGSGIETSKLNDKQRELKAQMATATGEIGKQSAALEILNRRQQSLHAARANYDKTIGVRNKMAMAGATTTAAGVAMGMPILKAVKDYASFEDAMLGVARQVEGARDANGNLTKTYYEMGESIKSMSERIPLATTEIAAIIEAGARMGIQGKANLLAYAETTAVMATAFDLPVDQVGEDVGKIAALYKVPIKNINELGDVINYLDDNALSKGGEIIDVMKRIAGTADSVGMKYREAAALASTFLSLGANSEVAASASNAMMTNLSVATMQSKRFQEGLKMLKMDAKGVQLGMSKDSTGTILKVMDAIKSLPQEKQLEATTRLFGKEFGDDAAKLASNLGEYRRQLELVNAAKAKGSMQREGDARSQAMSAQYEMMKNTVFNLSSALGESLKPALVDIMQSIAGVLRYVRDWVKEHPTLTASLIKGAAVIAALVTVIGALMLGIAAVLGPIAGLKLILAYIGIGAPVAAAGIMAVVGAVTKLTAAFAVGYAAGTLLNEAITYMLGDSLGSKIYDWTHKEEIKKLPVNQSGIKKNLAALSVGVAMSGAAAAQPVQIDNRPPITPASMRPQVAPVQTNTFTIHAAPGMNEQQLAQLVAREIEKLNRQQAATSRSRLTDRE